MVAQTAFAGTENAPALRAILISAIRAGRSEPRVIRLGAGPLLDFEEIAPGVRLWHGTSGDPLAVELEGQAEAKAG